MLELSTFGGLELRTGDGERVEALAGRTKCLALLAYLAVEAPEGRVHRETVAALLWPDRTDELSRASLRVALSQIRQATDPALVAGEGAPSIGLIRDHVRADVAAFRETLEAGADARALELYEGDFLAGVHVEEARPFQRWADRKRGHLRQQAYGAALSVGTSARAGGDLASAENAFRRALDLAPLREEAAAKLIRTLADRGRPADALQLYEAFRQRREAKLQMAPSQELDRLVEELKQAPPAPSSAVEDAGRASAPAIGDRSSEVTDATAVESGERPSPPSGGPTARKPYRWRRFRRRALLGALVAAGLLVGALAGARHLFDAGGEAATPAAGDRSVAVLPFESIGTEEPGAIAEGLHHDLLTRLSNVSGLEVISATSVERFRNTELPLPAIADSLEVRWIVEGDVQRAGDAIQVNAQLVDPRTDTHAWAATFRRELTAGELFDLQTEIASDIARSLKTELTASEQDRITRRPTGNLEAYRLYIRGRVLLEQRTTAEMRRALDYFRRALAEDSAYALAWAGLADGLSLLAHHRGANPDSALQEADHAARRALKLGPELAEARVARGRLFLFRHDGPAALRNLERAVEVGAGYAPAHAWLGKLLLTIGRPREALGHVERAVDLNPLSWENQATLAWAALANGHYEEALRAGRRATRLKSQVEKGFRAPSQYELLALSHLRRLGEPEADGSETGGNFLIRPLVALQRAEAGERDLAEGLLREEDGELAPLLKVLLNSALGHEERAFRIMREWFPREEGLWEVGGPIYLRYFWPDILAPLREDPRWDEFIGDVNRFWGLEPDGSVPEDAAVESLRLGGQ